MGILIGCDASAPIPRPITLTLCCDNDHGMLPVSTAWTMENYIDAHAAAMRAGWQETQSSNGRLFLCPGCSKKTPR